jgi:hypothetical protein
VGAPARRSAALLITVQLDSAGSVPWRATLVDYPDALGPVAPQRHLADPDEVLAAVRDWIEAFTR